MPTRLVNTPCSFFVETVLNDKNINEMNVKSMPRHYLIIQISPRGASFGMKPISVLNAPNDNRNNSTYSTPISSALH